MRQPTTAQWHRRLGLRRAVAAGCAAALVLSACSPSETDGGSGKGEGEGAAFTDVKKTTVEVQDLWANDQTGEGGSARNRITIEPSDSAGLKVGFQEDEVRGTGDMWRSSAWQATAVAFLLTGTSPTKKKITFDCVGPTDGPSAGGLLTVAVLAALTGDKVEDDITMTGTINPDGSIGPVGGIPHKLEGAKSVDKTRMLIPVGQSTDYDLTTGEPVDVVSKGKEMGIEVIEVDNVYEAYEEFTGKTLPRWGEKDANVELSSTAADRFEADTNAWIGRYQEAMAKFGTLTPELQAYYSPELSYIDDLAAESSRLAQGGQFAAAFIKAVFAGAEANGLYQRAQLNELFLTQGAGAGISQLESQASSSIRIDAAVEDLEGQKPKTVSDAGSLVEGFGDLAYAIGYYSNATAQLDAIETSQDPQLALDEAAQQYNYANLQVDLTEDLIEIQKGLDSPGLNKDVDVTVIADFLTQAADATYKALESFLEATYASELGVSGDVLLQKLVATDIDVATAVQSKVIGALFEEQLGEDNPALPYAKLGTALDLFLASSRVLARYMSLQSEEDEYGAIVGFKREKALTTMTDLADDQARRAVGVLNSEGVDASLVAGIYEIAKVDRESTLPGDQLEALTGFWNAYLYARILAYLGDFSSAGLGLS